MRFTCLLAIPLLACGGDNNNHLDSGGGGDGGGGDGGGGGNVSVIVTLDGAPAAGVQVYFQNADSSSGGAATTDANGSASGNVSAGGFVTVLEPSDPNAQIRPRVFDPNNQSIDTVGGIKAGDVIHVDVGGAATNDVPSVVNLTVPTDVNVNVATYQLYASCADTDQGVDITPGSGSGSGSAALRPRAILNNAPVNVQDLFNCANGSADILIVSTDANFTPLDFIFSPGIAVGSDAGSGTNVTITGSYAAMPNVTDQFTNMPADTQAVIADIDVSSALGDMIDSEAETDAGSGAFTTASVPVPMPSISGGQADSTLLVANGSADFDFILEDLTWAPGPAAAQTVDFTTIQLKNFTTEPSFDLASHTVSWTVGTTGATADLALIGMDIDRPVGSGSDADWFWTLATPNVGTGAYPTLPTDLFDFNAGSGDTVTVDEVLGAKFPGGYDAVRGLVFSNPITPLEAASSTGSIQLQIYEPAGLRVKAKQALRPAPHTHATRATRNAGKHATRIWRATRNR